MKIMGNGITNAQAFLEPIEKREGMQGDYIKALDETLRQYDDGKRLDPETSKTIYKFLKKEIDIINEKPENNKYLEIFSKRKEIHSRKNMNIIDELQKRISTLNLKTTTGKPKFENIKERKNIDINNATIDGKGVYKLLQVLSDNHIINELKVVYLEGTRTATEGITINEEGVGKNEGIKIKRKSKNREEGKDPYEKVIIDINSNLKHAEGATSSTRMLYEICKKAGLIERLPPQDQNTLERFVYFVDFAYRYKQRILGMDSRYIYGTLFGNYKGMPVWDIREYLEEDSKKTGFEAFTEEDAKKYKVFKRSINKEGQKEYDMIPLADVIDNKHKLIIKAIEEVDNLMEETSLTYTGPDKLEQTFIFDLEGKVQLLEEAAPIRRAGFVKLHKKNNELYVRSYYDLPTKFGNFTTENGNTIHFKLNKENLETFLQKFTGNENIKDKIREQFTKNNGSRLEPKVGEKFEGTIAKKKLGKDNNFLGYMITLQKKGHKPTRGLLHKSHIKNVDDFKKGESIQVEVERVSDKGIGLKIIGEGAKNIKNLVPPATEVGKPAKEISQEIELKQGDIVDGVIQNIVHFGAFVKIGKTGKTGLIHRKNIDPNKQVNVGDSIKVQIDSITDDPKDLGPAKGKNKKRISLTIANAIVVKANNEPVKNKETNTKLQETLNTLPESESLKIEKGAALKGVIYNIKEGLGVFIQVGKKYKDGKQGAGGLLHINTIEKDPNKRNEALKKFEKAQNIEVFVRSVQPDGRINFSLTIPKPQQKAEQKNSPSPKNVTTQKQALEK